MPVYLKLMLLTKASKAVSDSVKKEAQIVSAGLDTLSSDLKKVAAHTAVKEITIGDDDLMVAKEPLPAGQYLYRFVIRDVFGNRIDSGDLQPVNWDGTKVSYPTETENESSKGE